MPNPVRPFRDKQPRIADDVFVADNAIITGDVEIGAGSSVWFGVVIRGDSAPIRIGERTNIQDGTIVHADADAPVTVGNDVTIGHRAIIHGTTIGAGAQV
ncbi:MAG: gamma carbonic anhydrase family protein, partial [Thermomicrobiales bacterium]|nr:gamma carbonic anhydrase family protein [Thermomicrobiales bacterium]